MMFIGTAEEDQHSCTPFPCAACSLFHPAHREAFRARPASKRQGLSPSCASLVKAHWQHALHFLKPSWQAAVEVFQIQTVASGKGAVYRFDSVGVVCVAET